MKKENTQKSMSLAKAFFRLLPEIYKPAPMTFIFLIMITIIHGVSWGLQTLLTEHLFDRAADFALHKITFSAVVLALIFLVLSQMASQILNGLGNYIPMALFDKVKGAQSVSIHEKMSRLAPVCFEDTDILDNINKAEEGKNNAGWFIGGILTVFIFYGPYFLFMSFYLYRVKPILAVAIPLIFLPTLATQLLRAKVFSKLEDKAAPIRREFDYYESCMVGREYYKETRILGAFSFFRKQYHDALVLLNKLTLKTHLKANLAELSMKLLSLAGYVMILLMLFDALMKKEISVGAFAAVFASIGMLFALMDELICSHFAGIAQNFGTIQNYINFMDLPEREGSREPLPQGADISLENVSFAYPGAEGNAVENVSFTIHNGETVAVVGENGSGKSTLVRLITGLYLPNYGDVLYGDVNTKKVSMKSLFEKTSAVFQKYQRYQMTLRDNIQISDIDKNAEDSELDKICTQTGADKNDESYPNGYDTMLSREFDGVDLSGGQWQRIAIARSFFREHNLIVLDEPTAAIDPLEETKIYNRFAEAAKDKTAVIVTHRLGSVRLADKILVMKSGKLVQCGSHEELIARDGEYSQLYKAQEQWYN
jgi:ABC-type bacteriocin/lantibiotic exporters, contain an N-terminal double-glycine peptidase domain